MMREIEFRGLATIDEAELSERLIEHHGKWIHGTPIEDYMINGIVEVNGEYIAIEQWVSVDPSTISQYTGLRDKNGKKIFDGDIGWDDHTECWGVVVFDEGRFKYVWETVADDLYEVTSDIEVIGNKWQNPELLEAE